MATIDKEIEELACSIWDTLFEPALKLTPGGGPTTGHAVTGIVHVTGSWHGAVLLQCSTELASTLTAAMFQEPADPTPEQITDAVGELTNMLAGNVKALLPVPSSMSLPAVAFGSDYALSVIGSRTLSRREFVCDGMPLTVTVLQRSAEGPEGAS